MMKKQHILMIKFRMAADLSRTPSTISESGHESENVSKKEDIEKSFRNYRYQN